ncbi:LytR/AlgR family response regulator transcription factor [Tellurirhabdus bombi]|uniref:LytR/AlgR family response regulator transcription factor n=1 Tax=Tellurirhabdus bombi TaxID=2907205 RepID=UPI001F1877B8|nr:LytTR family DNA-binding domain-containing protein [Tellurirhabdus bombi]
MYSSSGPTYTEDQIRILDRELALPELTLPFWGGRKRVPAHCIIWLEGEGNYTLLHFNDGTHLMISLTLKKMETRLPPEIFVRPHKKNIINLLYLKEVYTDKIVLAKLTNGTEIEVSRRRGALFLQQVEKFKTDMLVLTQ